MLVVVLLLCSSVTAQAVELKGAELKESERQTELEELKGAEFEELKKLETLTTLLNSQSFASRRLARKKIVKISNSLAVSRLLKNPKLSVEQRMSLRYCLSAIERNRRQEQFQLLLQNKPTELPGWKEVSETCGDTLQARHFWAECYRKHSEFIELFASVPKSERSGVISSFIAEDGYSWQYWGVVAWMCCVEKSEFAQSRLRGRSYTYSEYDQGYYDRSPFFDVLNKLNSKALKTGYKRVLK